MSFKLFERKKKHSEQNLNVELLSEKALAGEVITPEVDLGDLDDEDFELLRDFAIDPAESDAGGGEVYRWVNSVSHLIGTSNPRRGKLNDQTMVIWDAVPPCEPEDCKIRLAGRCTYTPAKQNDGCVVLRMILKPILFETYARYQDLPPTDLYAIGLQLIPQYVSLCRLHLEMSIGGILTPGRGGSRKASPIMREARETTKLISQITHELDRKLRELKNEKQQVMKSAGSGHADRLLGGFGQ
jgi:hypothetical protein